MVLVSTRNVFALLGIAAMVSSDTGLPDPDNPNSDVRVSNLDVILVTDDEDSDDQEAFVLDEYQPLPMEENVDSNHESSEDEAYGPIDEPTNASMPSIIPIEDVLVKEVWCGATTKAVDIEMDNKKVDEVKQAMRNITLPSSSIPEWAANVPEDEWKNQLLKRLQNIQGVSK